MVGLESWYILVPAILIGVVVAALLLMWLWNTTLPELFGFKDVTLWQALKILIISTILTGGGSSILSYTTENTITNDNATIETRIQFGFP
ncbi:MAG: hypothetical protein KC426_09310 [Oceanospirillaceae bacterium]|nr:hypothetical protein [Oceanospirillaceae bacterium]